MKPSDSNGARYGRKPGALGTIKGELANYTDNGDSIDIQAVSGLPVRRYHVGFRGVEIEGHIYKIREHEPGSEPWQFQFEDNQLEAQLQSSLQDQAGLRWHISALESDLAQSRLSLMYEAGRVESAQKFINDLLKGVLPPKNLQTQAKNHESGSAAHHTDHRQSDQTQSPPSPFASLTPSETHTKSFRPSPPQLEVQVGILSPIPTDHIPQLTRERLPSKDSFNPSNASTPANAQ